MKILDTGKFLNNLFFGMFINVYPIIAENSAVMPFATYERTGTEHNSKDQQISRATYNISIYSEQYNESVELLQKVIDICRSQNHMFQEEPVRLSVDHTYESYNDCYVQTAVLIIEV
jgi:hypothetical protein